MSDLYSNNVLKSPPPSSYTTWLTYSYFYTLVNVMIKQSSAAHEINHFLDVLPNAEWSHLIENRAE